MKFSYVLLPAVVSAGVLDRRQGHGHGQTGGHGAAPKTPSPPQAAPKQNYGFITKELKPQLKRTDTKRTLTRVGPLKLVPGLSGRHGFSLDGNGQGVMLSIPKGTFCSGECTIISGKAGLELEDGSQADISKGVYIHHILGTNNGKKVQPFVSQCDYKGDAVAAVKRPAAAPAGFVGVSDDNGDQPIMYGLADGSIQGGYFYSKEDSIGVWADLVNLDKTEKVVYLTYDLEYVPGHVGVDSQGTLISVTGCQPQRGINASPNAPSNTTSERFKFFQDGYLVNGKGHLHDGGVAMDLHINGKYVCSSDALYGGSTGTRVQEDGNVWETISGMSICPGPIKIKEGDYMTLTSRYDLTKHPLRTTGAGGMNTAEIMGMWTMNYLPEPAAKPAA